MRTAREVLMPTGAVKRKRMEGTRARKAGGIKRRRTEGGRREG